MKNVVWLFLLSLMLAACASGPIGGDSRGKEFQAQANLVVAAIVRYKAKNGIFPEFIDDLAPDYLQKIPANLNFDSYLREKNSSHSERYTNARAEILYDRKNGMLGYDYTAPWPKPGRISCSTVIGSGKWDCHGYI